MERENILPLQNLQLIHGLGKTSFLLINIVMKNKYGKKFLLNGTDESEERAKTT